MSASLTNRVFLPGGKKIYLSDDVAGDNLALELYKLHGDLKMEVCDKEWGKSLDEAKPIWSGTLNENYEWESK